VEGWYKKKSICGWKNWIAENSLDSISIRNYSRKFLWVQSFVKMMYSLQNNLFLAVFMLARPEQFTTPYLSAS